MTETYDPDLLVTFLAVAETGSFSEPRGGGAYASRR